MEVCGRALGVCLLTGEAVTTDDEFVLRHASEKCRELTVVWQLTVAMASTTMLITATFRKAVRLRTVFLDKLGDEDIGIRVGNQLSISKTDPSDYLARPFFGIMHNLGTPRRTLYMCKHPAHTAR
jgi:hypothetical protein